MKSKFKELALFERFRPSFNQSTILHDKVTQFNETNCIDKDNSPNALKLCINNE